MEEKKKSNKGLIITLVIVIILLILSLAACGYLLLNKTEGKGEKKTEEKEVVEELKDVDLDNLLVTEARNFEINHICAGTSLNLNKKDIKVEDLTSLEKLNVVLSANADKIVLVTGEEDKNVRISEESIKRYFKDISFLDDFKPAVDSASDAETNEAGHKGAKVEHNLLWPVYMKYEDGAFLVEAYGTGCQGPSPEGLYLGLKSAQKNSEKLVLNYISYYSDPELDEDAQMFKYKVYKNKGDSKEVTTLEEDVRDISKLDAKDFDNYQFIFDIKDNNLRLVEIKYVK